MRDENGTLLEYGKISTTDTFFDGIRKSRQVSVTESFVPRDLVDTHALIFEKTSQLIAKNIAKKNITIVLDLDDRKMGSVIKHVHITHTAEKNEI